MTPNSPVALQLQALQELVDARERLVDELGRAHRDRCGLPGCPVCAAFDELLRKVGAFLEATP